MPLLKRSQSSASINTTASVFTRRGNKYQKALGITNVYIMLSSFIMIVLGIVFMNVYHMDKIYVYGENSRLNDLWSYGQLPMLLIGIGIGTFVLATLGFLFLTMESKPPLMVYSILLGMLVFAQFYFIFVTFDANSKISNEDRVEIKNNLETEGLELYLKDASFRKNWDTVQLDLRCCGFQQEYAEDWTSLNGDRMRNFMNISGNRCFPESCCIRSERSTDQLCREARNEDLNSHTTRCRAGQTEPKALKSKMRALNIRRCPEVIQEKYIEYLPNLFFFLEIHGGLTILVEVISIALSSAFVAQITRRAKRYNMGTSAGIEMD